MTLDLFNRHPEKIAMANCAQLINCLNSLYLAHEDKFVVTPVGHVFAMYAAHQGGQGLRTMFSAPTIEYDLANQSMVGLNVASPSAQLHHVTESKTRRRRENLSPSHPNKGAASIYATKNEELTAPILESASPNVFCNSGWAPGSRFLSM